MGRKKKRTGQREFTPLKREIWKIGLYIRLSRDDGGDESLSVINQKKILVEFVERCFQEEHIVRDIYIDDGKSGTDHDRPEFQRMILDIKEKKVNCIICKNLSRAFRNYSDQGYFLEKFFPQTGTRFITLDGPKIDTFLEPEAVNGLEVPINGLMNDRFAYKTSVDIRRTFDMKRRKGEFIGAFAPYGYRKDPEDKNRLIIDPEAAEVVKNIFQWYVYGDERERKNREEGQSSRQGRMSKAGIARKLNSMGILNPSAYKFRNGSNYYNPNSSISDGSWQGSSVGAILSNEIYTGTMVQGRQKVVSYKIHDKVAVPQEQWFKVPHTHEAIIDRQLFELAGEIQRRDIRCAPGNSQDHLFAGMLICADCRRAMTRKPSKDKVYFNCSTYKRKSREQCSIHSIRLDVLEQAVLTVIQKQIDLADHIQETAEQVKQELDREGKQEKLESILKLRRQEIEKAEELKDEIYLEWKRENIDEMRYRKLKNRLEDQIERLKRQTVHIQEEISGIDGEGDLSSSYIKYFLDHKNISCLSQGLIFQLINKILIHKNGELTIDFKFKDPFLSLLNRQQTLH